MTKLTRRTFIKLASAGAGLAVIENTLAPVLNADELVRGGKSVSRTTGLPRRSIPSTCAMCPARCGILGFVEENTLVKIEGNPRDPNSQGRLCAKGHAGVNIVYNPDRLLYPIHRKGPRGSGQWTRISWDEALDDLADRLKPLRAKVKTDELIYIGGVLEGTSGIADRFLRAFGSSKALDEGALFGANRSAALRASFGDDTYVPDLAKARYIIAFGSNPAESHPMFLPLVQRLVDAQANGAKLVTFDPRLSGTAGRSVEWFPLRPGSDATVVLAMANVIVQRGLYDVTFVKKWLNATLDDLLAHLAPYTLARAARASGLLAGDIERVAVEFATRKPSVTISGGGISQQPDGTFAESAVALLNALAGNIDVNGGYWMPRRYALPEPDPAPAALSASCAACTNLATYFAALREGRERVGVLVSNMANPVYNSPNGTLVADALRDEGLVPFHVAFDSYLTETATLADLVLPAATYLESWDVYSPPAFEMVPFINMTQPVIKPLGESQSFADVLIQLAKRIGGDVAKYFSFGSSEEYFAAVARTTPVAAKAGGLQRTASIANDAGLTLKRNGVWFNPADARVERAYERYGFATSSGKFEVNTMLLAAQGKAPSIEEAAAESEGHEVTLVTFRSPVHSYSRTANSMWLSEIVHDNPVWIHPERAAALGVKRGDEITVQSDAGSIKTRAWITEAIRPDVVAVAASVGHWAGSRIARAKLFRSDEPNTEHIWWAKHGNGVHPYPIIPLVTDPVGGGPSWLALKVTITKA